MELKINLASASLKDAEHAIFIIGAYFGMTNLPTVPADRREHADTFGRVPYTEPRPAVALSTATAAPPVVLPALSTALPPAPGPVIVPAIAPHLSAPAELSAAEVFAGNVLPPVAPTAPAPAGIPAAPAPAPVASVTPGGVELDNEGLPWDARINALGDGGAHPKKADGTWRAKRGLNDGTLVARVKAELRQTLAAGAFAPLPGVPGPGEVFAASRVPTAPVAPVAPAVPPVPPTVPPVAGLPPAPPAVPSVPAGPPTTFEQLMPRITPVVAAGHLPSSALHTAATAYGLPNAMALTQRPDMVPSVWAYLQSICPQLQ